ncbi:unnamed protein product [Brassica rapa]|uniref:Uncharacterized protein n=2 Tax=Brassica TaxID=3705 RepID=A0A3P6A904_BRACM|nr:unnamed protein product [Brassica napus]CAG7894409.1 unnamed protein product [Brassica rapa]CDY28149.1 BnaAnng03260D [Brassica napus]VDC90216.1 unnamed protein product [Brassica rapa]
MVVAKVSAIVGSKMNLAMHFAASMLMFHRRSMQSTSSYSSSLIAFLDRWFVKSWVTDFEKQDKETIELADMYSKTFSGEFPEQFVTGDNLHIGCIFRGLSDKIIPAQRMKLAAEIYEEVAEVDAER